MKRTFTPILITLALALAASAQMLDLSGKWKVFWLQGGKPNAIELTEDTSARPTGFVGSYIADSGESCAVFGFRTDRKITMRVVCEAWSINMAGVLQDDDGTIVGTYTAYDDTVSGDFRMERIYCMLPEGCK